MIHPGQRTSFIFTVQQSWQLNDGMCGMCAHPIQQQLISNKCETFLVLVFDKNGTEPQTIEMDADENEKRTQ